MFRLFECFLSVTEADFFLQHCILDVFSMRYSFEVFSFEVHGVDMDADMNVGVQSMPSAETGAHMQLSIVCRSTGRRE